MKPLLDFEPYLAASLPETYALLRSSNLILHPSVSCVVLHGSRGLAGGFRSDSDIDLSLIVNTVEDREKELLLLDVVNTTLKTWRGPIELDLAVIFDIRKCGLKCFDQSMWNKDICRLDGVDCFGLYKTQRGFHGLVTHAGIQVMLMYPCLKIWVRR